MKNIATTIAAASVLILCAASCSTKYSLVPDPPVVNDYVTSVNIIFPEHTWDGTERLGLFGSEVGSNAMYVPSKSSIGLVGGADVYGSPVRGALRAYFPYDPEMDPNVIMSGRVPVRSVQEYCTSPEEALVNSTCMYAAQSTEDGAGSLRLEYVAGLLHLPVKAEVKGEVKSIRLGSLNEYVAGNVSVDPSDPVRIVDGANEITLRGLGTSIGEGEKIDVLFVLPAGEYASLYLTIVSDEETILMTVPQKNLKIEPGKVFEATVSDPTYDYDTPIITPIDGEFD